MSTTDTIATTTPTPTASSTKLAQTSSDYNMFLKLLTTQMQNQDPLKPMDSTEYTSQLAQFSQVEQTIQQTTTLNNILSQLSTQNIAQANGLIGTVAHFDTATAGLGATAPATWGYEADRAVTGLTATITDAAGKAVAKLPIEPADRTGSITWDGMLASGERAAAGAYTLSIAATDIGGDTVPVAITTSGVIGDVVSGGGAVTLGVNGVQIALTKLIKLSAPAT